MSAAEKQWTEANLLDLLELKYGHNPEKRVFMRHVADGTGMAKGRTIDAFAFEVWPSRGYITRAFEVKVSRSDFLAELAEPAKRQAWSHQVSEFWYVAPRGVIPVEELPDGCGLLVPRGSQLVRARHAGTRDHAQLDTPTVAALMRASSRELASLRREVQEVATLRGEPVTLDKLRALVWAARRRYGSRDAHVESEARRMLLEMREQRREHSRDLEEIVQELRRALGKRLPYPWGSHPFSGLDELLAEVKRVRFLAEEAGDTRSRLARARGALRDALAALDEAMAPEQGGAA